MDGWVGNLVQYCCHFPFCRILEDRGEVFHVISYMFSPCDVQPMWSNDVSILIFFIFIFKLQIQMMKLTGETSMLCIYLYGLWVCCSQPVTFWSCLVIDNQLEMTTKRTIMENEQMSIELAYQSRQTEKLLSKNNVLIEENRWASLFMPICSNHSF